MKTKKLCALILSLMLVFSCFAVIPFTASATSDPVYMAKLTYTRDDTWRYLQNEFTLAAGTYQFDVDYVTSGSVAPKVTFKSGATTDSTADDSSHITVRFTWTGGAFNLFLRDNDFKGTGTIYFANPVLKAVSGGVTTGDNLVWDFSRQYTEAGATITETYAWGGKWYKSGASTNAVFTVEEDTHGYFTAPEPEPLATTATTKAVYIGQCASGSQQAATVFIPLTSKYSGDYKIADGCYVEFTCKVKVLSGTKPVVGVLRTKTNGGNGTVITPTWADNTTSTLIGDTFTIRFELDDIPGDSNCYKSEKRNTTDYQPAGSYGSGGIWGGITIGNTAFNNTWNRQSDWNGSYIISEPSMKVCTKADGTAYEGGEMLVGFDQCNTQGIYGLAGRKTIGNNTDAMNHPWRAPANKWSIMGNNPDLVKFVTVDDSYTVSSRTYVQHAETSTTREYYTCEDFGDTKFEKFGTGCYSVIPDDVNKKAVIIGSDGTNKVANIYLPLFTHRYFQAVGRDDLTSGGWRDGYSNGTAGGNVFYHISFNAKRLSGSGQPILGRLYGADWGHADAEFRPGENAAYNGSGDVTSQASYCTSSYNAATGQFTAVVRFNKGYMYQTCRKGYNEILTIGNAEYSDESSGVTVGSGKFDATNFGSSFAISDISIQVYDADNTTLLDSEAAPQMVAGNYWFDPDPDTIDDHTSQHMFSTTLTNENDNQNLNGRPISLFNIPIDTWGCDGAQSLVSVVNRSDCLANNHELTYHAADPANGTREYWGCATCRTCYADPYGNEDIGNDTSATNKMIVVKASGSTQGNALLPLAMPSSAGTHYYKFTCDMKVFGEQTPTISMVRGSWWGGNGALAQEGWTNNSDEPTEEGLYAYYDAETGKYEAVIKIEHSSDTFAYANSLTGAYAGLLLGNGRHVGNGYTESKYFTTFAFTNPELYELEDAEDTDSIIGGNLAAPITDKTLNFGSAYSALPANQYSGEWTMYRTNNLLSAPTGKWSVDSSTTWVNQADIPDDFFSSTDAPENYMLHFGGRAGNYNYIVRQTFLERGKTYQFDIDYRETSTPARIAVETAGESSYSYATLTATSDDVPGAHKSVRFTMGSDARLSSGGGNFRLSLGQCVPSSGIQKTTNNVYFANASLREVIGDELGENLFINGSFEFGGKGGLTDENYLNTIYGWESYTANNMPNILIPHTRELMPIPEHFFDGVLGQYATDKAVRFEGQNYQYVRAKVELEPGTTYRLTYLYRGEDDLSSLGVTTAGSNSGTYTVENNYMKNAGKFEASYNITTGSDVTSNGNQDPNTWIDFRNGANVGSDQIMYISDIRLQKLVDGVPTGSNLLGDYNPVYDDSYYPNDVNTATFAGDTDAAVGRVFVHNWLSSKTSSNGAVVKVSDGFFNYYTGAQKIALMQQKLLGVTDGYNPYNDAINPYNEVTGDGVYNILDLVRLKKMVAISDEGGAGYEAAMLKNKIMNAENIGTAPSGKKTYYVSATGSDSNAGTSTGAALKTIAAANNKATSGDYILLKRGDTFRLPAGTGSIATKAGVTYGSYGTGAKPLINGSVKNYATNSWTNDGTNIWKTRITSDAHTANNPGLVYFFNNATDDEPTLVSRIVKNGARFASKDALEQQGDVYYKLNTEFDGYVYVYSTENPGSRYGKIEIGEHRDTVTLASNVTIDNIAVKFAGGHAINGTGLSNVTIQNCEIGYVGGTPNGSETMGNGIQFGQGGSNLKIENCYVYECFDAGITFQSWGSSATTFNGVYFRDNLLTNNFYNIEFFTTGAPENKSGASSGTADGTFKNIEISGNIMRFAGECNSYEQRQDTKLRAANIMVTTGAYYVNTQNLNITDNIFDCTMVSQICWFWQNLTAHADKQTHVGVTISGNTYYQKAGSNDGRVNRWRGNDTYDYAGSTSTLATAINKMDTAPKMIQWVNRADRV